MEKKESFKLYSYIMKSVSPVIPNENHKEVIIAEHQDEYQNLPSIRLADQSILTRWELTDEEKAIVAETGSIYLNMLTFGKPVMPVMMFVEKPEIVYQNATIINKCNDCGVSGINLPENKECGNCGSLNTNSTSV